MADNVLVLNLDVSMNISLKRKKTSNLGPKYWQYSMNTNSRLMKKNTTIYGRCFIFKRGYYDRIDG
jgi:hypothetical protein